MQRSQTIKQILIKYRPLWDSALTRPVVRENFQKVIDCGTAALGFNVYGSDEYGGERKLVPHTCKSRACPSCGHWGTMIWQKEIEAMLPDIRYAHITLTMPDTFWEIFRNNRGLLKDLPTIGARVVLERAQKTCGAQVMVLVVRHSFGGKLNFNSHVHILASTAGLDSTGNLLVQDVRYSKDAIVSEWRQQLLNYLDLALDQGLISSKLTQLQLRRLFREHRTRLWIAYVSYAGMDNILGYISRYLRRPPIAEYKLLPSRYNEVRFTTEDKQQQRDVVITLSAREFLSRLADQVHDHYCHGVRYYGLLAPRAVGASYEVFLSLLGQRRRPRPPRKRWADSIVEMTGIHPLRSADGRDMPLVGQISPNPKKKDH